MRPLHSLVGSLSLAGVIACGGGSHPVIIDVPIPPDTPVDAFMCEFMSTANINTMNTPLDFATDFTGGPVILNAMATTETPPALEFGINISGLFSMHPNTTLLMIWHDKHGVSAGGAGTAGLMTGPPVAGVYNLDDDQNFGAGFDIVTYKAGAMGPDTNAPTQAYVLNNMGTAKFNLTAWDVKAVANAMS